MNKNITFNSNNLLELKFTKNVKGYDAYQVDTTLDKVINDYRYYENFYIKAKEYIAQLESDIKKMRDELRKKEVEIAKYEKRFEGIKNQTNVTSENIDLLKRINQLEKALYARGLDPSKIK